MKSSLSRPTKAEAARIDRMKEIIGCICCRLSGLETATHLEVHHIKAGNKRLSHWYTLSLCWMHHQNMSIAGLWTSIAQGSKAFAEVHGSQWDLWLKTQHILELDDTLPASKLVARRLA